MSLSQDFDLIRFLADDSKLPWQIAMLECDYRGYNESVWSLISAVLHCDAEPDDKKRAEILYMTAGRRYESTFWQGLATWKQSQYSTVVKFKQHQIETLQKHMRTAVFRDKNDHQYLLRQIEAAVLDCPEVVTETTWYARSRLISQMIEAGDYDAPKRVLQLVNVPRERPDLKQIGSDLVREIFNRVGQPGMAYSRRQMVELTLEWKKHT
ncbi:TPA: hypothetical protein DEP96_03715 [Candidatus Uhrbacteria bacterium]|nr:hypothetical protein [Candidatus Uhrbacteria bacterium]